MCLICRSIEGYLLLPVGDSTRRKNSIGNRLSTYSHWVSNNLVKRILFRH